MHVEETPAERNFWQSAINTDEARTLILHVVEELLHGEQLLLAAHGLRGPRRQHKAAELRRRPVRQRPLPRPPPVPRLPGPGLPARGAAALALRCARDKPSGPRAAWPAACALPPSCPGGSAAPAVLTVLTRSCSPARAAAAASGGPLLGSAGRGWPPSARLGCAASAAACGEAEANTSAAPRRWLPLKRTGSAAAAASFCGGALQHPERRFCCCDCCGCCRRCAMRWRFCRSMLTMFGRPGCSEQDLRTSAGFPPALLTCKCCPALPWA